MSYQIALSFEQKAKKRSKETMDNTVKN